MFFYSFLVKVFAFFWLIMTLFITPQSLFAQSSAQQDTLLQNRAPYADPFQNTNLVAAPFSQNKKVEVSFTMLWIKLFLSLATFAIVAFFSIKWLARRRKKLLPKSDLFQTIAQFPLAPNRNLQIVRVVEEYYLLGVTPEQITSLSKLDKKETIDQLQLKSGNTSHSLGFFQEMINQYFSKDLQNPQSKPTNNEKNNPLQAIQVTQFLKKKLQDS